MAKKGMRDPRAVDGIIPFRFKSDEGFVIVDDVDPRLGIRDPDSDNAIARHRLRIADRRPRQCRQHAADGKRLRCFRSRSSTYRSSVARTMRVTEK